MSWGGHSAGATRWSADDGLGRGSRLQYPVAAVAEQRPDDLPVAGYVVDHQDGRHYHLLGWSPWWTFFAV